METKYFSNWIVFFCHNRRKTSLEKFWNIISTLNARTRARFSRCYIWCENNKRPSEDFHSKLIIDNMYVEVALQTEYNIRKNSRNFCLQFKFTGIWRAQGRAHESHDAKTELFYRCGMDFHVSSWSNDKNSRDYPYSWPPPNHLLTVKIWFHVGNKT